MFKPYKLDSIDDSHKVIKERIFVESCYDVWEESKYSIRSTLMEFIENKNDEAASQKEIDELVFNLKNDIIDSFGLIPKGSKMVEIKFEDEEITSIYIIDPNGDHIAEEMNLTNTYDKFLNEKW